MPAGRAAAPVRRAADRRAAPADCRRCCRHTGNTGHRPPRGRAGRTSFGAAARSPKWRTPAARRRKPAGAIATAPATRPATARRRRGRPAGKSPPAAAAGQMDQDLSRQRQQPGECMRIGVAEQQGCLEEYQAGAPHRRRAAEPWQHHLGHHRFDQEHQAGAEEQRGHEAWQHKGGRQQAGARGRVGVQAGFRSLCGAIGELPPAAHRCQRRRQAWRRGAAWRTADFSNADILWTSALAVPAEEQAGHRVVQFPVGLDKKRPVVGWKECRR